MEKMMEMEKKSLVEGGEGEKENTPDKILAFY